MSAQEITDYIDKQSEPKRSTLQQVRELILAADPRLEEAVAWNSPQFKLNGKFVAGLCAFKNHLTFTPHSPEVLIALEAELEGFVVSKSSFQFAVDQPLSAELVAELVQRRVSELA